MAPWGDGIGALVCMLTLFLASASAEVSSTVSAKEQCSSIDDVLDTALNQNPDAPTPTVVRLEAGCSMLQRDHVSTPIRWPMTVEGGANGSSIWDTAFDLYQFSIDSGVTVTLRNMVLSNALILTGGFINLQPAVLNMRNASRLVLQNVTIQTLCSTIQYYLNNAHFPIGQMVLPAIQSSTQPSFFVPAYTRSGITLQNVTLTCDPTAALPNMVDLRVGTAGMLSAFVCAANGLGLPSTIHLMDNITLPYVSSYDREAPDPRVSTVTVDTILDGNNTSDTDGSTTLSYVDANYTSAWLYVQPPARLTLRRMVLTRLRTSLWSLGVMDGVLAGAVPVFMVQLPNVDTPTLQPAPRIFQDVTLVLPQYEIPQIAYWCVMVNIMSPGFTHVADFVRSNLWQSDCDVLDGTQVLFRKVRDFGTSYQRTLLTSVAPAGVPSDPDTQPPAGSEAYPHITPPLFLVSSGAEWAEAAAPVLIQLGSDYYSPPAAAEDDAATGDTDGGNGIGVGGIGVGCIGGNDSSSTDSTDSGDTLGSSTGSIGDIGGRRRSAAAAAASASTSQQQQQLPVLVLVNGTVELTMQDLSDNNNDGRVVRRSVLVTSMRRGCGTGAGCPEAVIDFGELVDALRIEGDNTTLAFEGVTLRNIKVALVVTGGCSGLGIDDFFMFSRLNTQVTFTSVNMQLSAARFAELHHMLTSAPWGNSPSGFEVYSMNASLIQLASFEVCGLQGSWVNVTSLPPGEFPPPSFGGGISGGLGGGPIDMGNDNSSSGGGSSIGNSSSNGSSSGNSTSSGSGSSSGGSSNSSTGGNSSNSSTGGNSSNSSTGGNSNNGSTGGNSNDGSSGGSSNNGSTGGSSNNGSTGGSNNNGSTGGSNNNGSTGGGSNNGSTGGSSNNGSTRGSSNNGSTGGSSSSSGGSSSSGLAASGNADASKRTILGACIGSIGALLTLTFIVFAFVYRRRAEQAGRHSAQRPDPKATLVVDQELGSGLGSSSGSSLTFKAPSGTAPAAPTALAATASSATAVPADPITPLAAAATLAEAPGSVGGSHGRAGDTGAHDAGLLQASSWTTAAANASSEAAGQLSDPRAGALLEQPEERCLLPAAADTAAAHADAPQPQAIGSVCSACGCWRGVGSQSAQGPADGQPRCRCMGAEPSFRCSGGGAEAAAPGAGPYTLPLAPAFLSRGEPALASALSSAGALPTVLDISVELAARTASGGPTSGSSTSTITAAGAAASSPRLMSRILSGGRASTMGIADGSRLGLGCRRSSPRPWRRLSSRQARSIASSSGDAAFGSGASVHGGLLPASGRLAAPEHARLGPVTPSSASTTGQRQLPMVGLGPAAGLGAALFPSSHAGGHQSRCTATGIMAVQRRERSQPSLLGMDGGGGAGSAVGGVPVAVGGLHGSDPHASQSTAHLTATFGRNSTGHDDVDSSLYSPGVSNPNLYKVPEPASEVQRLISELSAQSTDQLVILEPIGQGGYGTVYRGVWRNLDVAVKTVLFQDRATVVPVVPVPGAASLLHASVPRKGSLAEGLSSEWPQQALEQRQEPVSTSDAALCSPVQSLSVQPTPFSGGDLAAPSMRASISSLVTGGTAGAASGGGQGAAQQSHIAGHQQKQQGAPQCSALPKVSAGMGAAGPIAGHHTGVASQQRAVLEAAVSCSVAHPNVVATFHYDITPVRPAAGVCSGGLQVSDAYRAGAPAGGAAIPSDWKLYLVQEFCDAGSLANALDHRAFHDAVGMPNLALTLCVLADIARGMSHIHSRSIVHGDLNPTNILLRTAAQRSRTFQGTAPSPAAANCGGGTSGSTTPGGGAAAAAAAMSGGTSLRHELGIGLVAKVGDFGLCGMLAPGKRHISNAQRGTPFYTAPETVAIGTLTKASDVYSFGVIAWEVCTGRPPFRHLPEQGFVRDDTFPCLPPHVPPTFANMITACLSADPDARPTFEQILDRLSSLQSKLAASLQQRLSRLVASHNGTLHTGGIGSPAAPVSGSPPVIGPSTASVACGGVSAAGVAFGLGMPPRSGGSSSVGPMGTQNPSAFFGAGPGMPPVVPSNHGAFAGGR